MATPTPPKCPDPCDLVRDTDRRITSMEKAFSLTPDGDRNYAQHRAHHEEHIEAQKHRKTFITAATDKVLLGLLLSVFYFTRNAIVDSLVAIFKGVTK